ncbi:histidine phosphatase superfamily [Trametes maxima]|nr:histidine phosphatase superfamily [Trametes maxima]
MEKSYQELPPSALPPPSNASHALDSLPWKNSLLAYAVVARSGCSPAPCLTVLPPTHLLHPTPGRVYRHIGHAGPTPTGAEPALVATAPVYPIHTGAPHLLGLEALRNHSKQPFDISRHWGNLSPWFSVGRNAFGVDAGPEPPQGCRVTGLHLLYRHGALYPTGRASFGGPANFSARLGQSPEPWQTCGELKFLNDWTYILGEEILTPFGRQQLFDLGVSMRLKNGFLRNFTATNTLPVFLTESQDQMLASAHNFALAFFGYPLDGQYQQLVTIEGHGFNNTLAPSETCHNAHAPSRGDRAVPFVRAWGTRYLRGELTRLAPQIEGFELTLEDVYVMQQLCAYEFFKLFTEEEWEGFDYAHVRSCIDLYFWYNSAYVQELVARLTHTPIETYNSSTNATLDDNPATFPLGQSLYVDAAHEVVVLNVITALNLTSFAEDGPLPIDHILHNHAFKTSHLAPLVINVQFQLLSCASSPDPQIRVIINDGVAPLTGIRGCPDTADGTCPVPTFVAAQREIIRDADWAWACLGEWEVPPGRPLRH